MASLRRHCYVVRYTGTCFTARRPGGRHEWRPYGGAVTPCVIPGCPLRLGDRADIYLQGRYGSWRLIAAASTATTAVTPPLRPPAIDSEFLILNSELMYPPPHRTTSPPSNHPYHQKSSLTANSSVTISSSSSEGSSAMGTNTVCHASCGSSAISPGRLITVPSCP